jgi:hypothetical protein
MRNRVLVVGNVSLCSSLARALINIVPLKRSLARFLYSRNVGDKLLTCNVDYLDKMLPENRDIKLIIACLDLPTFGLIRDIRVGKYGESIARVPMVVFSLHFFTETSMPLILYDIWQSGALFQVPFKLEEVWKALEAIRFLNNQQLSRIRSDRAIFYQVIDSVAHSLSENNCQKSVEYILSLADSTFPDEFVTIKNLRDALNGYEGVNGSIFEHVKHALNTLKREVSTDGN